MTIEVRLQELQRTISTLISRVKDADLEARRIVESFTFSGDVLDWLNAQSIFPKFYWCDREGSEEVAVLGEVQSFTEPSSTYAYITQEQRIWGGRRFDSKSSNTEQGYFFLPIIELIHSLEHISSKPSYDEEKNSDSSRSCWQLAVNFSHDRTIALETLQALNSVFEPIAAVDVQVKQLIHQPNEPQWRTLVTSVLSGIERDQFQKVVLARKSDLTLSHSLSALQLLRAARQVNHHSFHFMLSLNQDDSFVGSTPERLYSRIGTALQTEALAGTIERGSDPYHDQQLANWLARDDKNQVENQYVVDDIAERLAPLAESVAIEPQAKLLKLRKVQHLKRGISSVLKAGIHGAHLLSTLQPTAAVAGLPRDESLQFILDNEPFERGWYAGSMGYISHQRAEFCVAIRSAHFKHNRCSLYAGAGIVSGSSADKEWKELDNKMATLLSLIEPQQQ